MLGIIARPTEQITLCANGLVEVDSRDEAITTLGAGCSSSYAIATTLRDFLPNITAKGIAKGTVEQTQSLGYNAPGSVQWIEGEI